MTEGGPPAIRVLVAEDSTVTREALLYLLNATPGMETVGTARDGKEAVEAACRLKPDVVLMDVHMPRLGGYEATRQIMERAPAPIVMMSVSLSQDQASMTFEALRAGAVTIVETPGGPHHPRHAETARTLVETVRLMAGVKVIRRWPARRPRASGAPRPPATTRRVRLVAIGASTGGPAVVADILERLPAGAGAPILLVQHIAPGFVAALATWLGTRTRLGVKLAEPRETLRPATVYVAPDGHHLGVDAGGRVVLSDAPPRDGFRPSASFLFESVAETVGAGAMGVLLTGMGRDGAAGLRRLREAGGVTVAQDRESSIIFGMPREAIRLDAAQHILSPEDIAALIGAAGASA